MEIKLEVKLPVLISDDYLNVTNAVINDDSLFMLDMDRLIREERGIGNLTKYLLKYKSYDNYEEIKKFYKTIDTENYKIKPEISVDKEFIRVINSNSHGSNKARDIILTMGNYQIINDSKYFIPLIPGSTVKGAIRNAVRNFYVKQLNDSLAYSNRSFFNRKLSEDYPRGDKNLDNVLFLDDIFRFVNVKDFYSDNYKLYLYNLSRNKLQGGNKGIPLYAITISSGTFNGQISISNQLNNILKNNVKEKGRIVNIINEILEINFDGNVDNYKNDILKRILEITTNYNKEILSSEKEYYDIDIDQPLIIGFGGGIEEKTVIRSLNENVYSAEQNYIESRNGKLKLNDERMPATAWMINKNKFGVLEVEY